MKIPSDELKWAKQYTDSDAKEEVVYTGPGVSSNAEYLEFEGAYSRGLLEAYVKPIAPNDVLIRIDTDTGEVTRYPQTYSPYDYEPLS